jgi:hypothetical protein
LDRVEAVFVRDVKAAFVSFEAELNEGNDDLEFFSAVPIEQSGMVARTELGENLAHLWG